MDFEFEKNTTVDSIDRVPEHFRTLYTEADGKFTIPEPFLPTAKALDGINKALKAARKDADKAKKGVVDLTPYRQLATLLEIEGIDEAEVTHEHLKTGIEGLISKASKGSQVNLDKIKADIEKGYTKKLADKDAENQGLTKALNKYLVSSAAVAAIAEEKGVSALLLPHIERQVRVVKDGEDYQVRVVDAAGDPRANSSGGFMTIKDLVKEMKASADFGRAFDAEVKGGGGKSPTGSPQRPAGSSHQPAGTTKTAMDKMRDGMKKRGMI